MGKNKLPVILEPEEAQNFTLSSSDKFYIFIDIC